MASDEYMVQATEPYAGLITEQNYNKPRYINYVRSVLMHGMELTSTLETIVSAFELDNAVGAQLDMIGELVGLRRLLPYAITNGSREMDDDEYRTAIKLKIAQNTWDGTARSANDVYRSLFGNRATFYQRDDPDHNMSVLITISGNFSVRGAEILRSASLFLVPAGVYSDVEVISDDIKTKGYTGTAITGIAMSDTVQMLETGGN